ncbi:MAG: fatty acid desaturase [Gammaproteobacteria bacterium]|nr:fatty acid desaturase [Gammaproteobacteria bacterium]
MPREYPIPGRLNLTLAVCIYAAAIGLLWLASHLPTLWALPIGIAFSFILLSNYALMHEASHDVLHPHPPINDSVGALLGWLFPVSFTLMKVTHIVHHCCNRTDHEMFDCYYPGDSRVLKWGQWYGLLLGLWWYLIPIGSLLLAAVPGWLRSRPFRRARSTAVLFDDFGAAEMRRVRYEALFGIGFWVLLFHALELRWDAVLIAYAAFAFNWSTRQYVTHAFTPRDVRDGALNLRVSRPIGWLLLNGHWDRVHHQHPHLPWRYLPEIGQAEGYDRDYLNQYLSLWSGPRPCNEPAPAVLPRTVYQGLA